MIVWFNYRNALIKMMVIKHLAPCELFDESNKELTLASMKYLARPSAKRCWQYSTPGISLSIEFKPIAATVFCLGSLVNGFCLLLSTMISRFFHSFCWLVRRIVSVFPVTEGKGVQFPHNCEYSTIIWLQNISYRKFRWTFFCKEPFRVYKYLVAYLRCRPP